MRIPPLEINILLESNPLKPTMLVGGLGVPVAEREGPGLGPTARPRQELREAEEAA